MATHSSILAWRIPMDKGAWQAIVRGAAKSQTQLSDLSKRMQLVSSHCAKTWLLYQSHIFTFFY